MNKYGVTNIKIPDEMFFLHPNHVIEICDLIIERGYDLNIWAYARIDTVQQSLLSKLKRAGFNWLGLGIESGSVHVRDGSLKAIDEENIFETVEQIKQADINIGANYIFGLPDDDFDSMQQTLDLALSLNTELCNFYSAMAYPGSPLHKMAREKNIMLPESPGGPGWIGYSQHAYETFPLKNDQLSISDIIQFRDDAHNKYFSSHNFLNLIESKFGNSTREHLEDINKIKLRRKYA